MLINKAAEDKRYGKLTKVNRSNDSSIQASSVTHSFEGTALGVPRTKSLPLPRGAQIAKPPVTPPQHEQPLMPNSKGSSHHQSRYSNGCCVLQ